MKNKKEKSKHFKKEDTKQLNYEMFTLSVFSLLITLKESLYKIMR